MTRHFVWKLFNVRQNKDIFTHSVDETGGRANMR